MKVERRERGDKENKSKTEKEERIEKQIDRKKRKNRERERKRKEMNITVEERRQNRKKGKWNVSKARTNLNVPASINKGKLDSLHRFLKTPVSLIPQHLLNNHQYALSYNKDIFPEWRWLNPIFV